jgi:hypothetical protein
MFNIVIFPYRDLYFAKKYGYSVRDLQIIKILKESEQVKSITVVNRPVSLYERVINKSAKSLPPSIDYFDTTSWDLIGPISGRKWTQNCYNKSEIVISKKRNNNYNPREVNVILDFLPIAKINYDLYENHFVWYDLIDNFEKHNRFDIPEKRLVRDKYNYVNRRADLITGVSNSSIARFNNEKMVVSNGIFDKPIFFSDSSKYTVGFIGFITDKFDIDFVEYISNLGHRLAIYGKSYDKRITSRLIKNKNIDVYGEFTRSDLPKIMDTFDIGLLPYIREKSHDGSPLKLYEYLNYGKPTISKELFEIDNDYVFVFQEHQKKNMLKFISDCIERKKSCPVVFRQEIRKTIREDYFLTNKLNLVLDRILDMSSQKTKLIGDTCP